MMTKIMFAILALGVASPALAQTPPNARANARLGALRSGGTPYRSLFQTPAPVAPSTLPAAPKAPRVVCGMTLIPGDAKVDPKMQHAPKADGTEYTIRAIDPPICKP